jgi:hypothetical protein
VRAPVAQLNPVHDRYRLTGSSSEARLSRSVAHDAYDAAGDPGERAGDGEADRQHGRAEPERERLEHLVAAVAVEVRGGCGVAAFGDPVVCGPGWPVEGPGGVGA